MSVNVTFRTSEETKEKASRIYQQLGLSVSSAINMFLEATIRENGLPISTKLPDPTQVEQEKYVFDKDNDYIDNFRPQEFSRILEALTHYQTNKHGESIVPLDELLDDGFEDDPDYAEEIASLQTQTDKEGVHG